ncbi:MAG TPA: DUF4159 domain-containing protein [Saprospiraceae bacterium]|nr:DUF4159 domain-containing protein [Saprospiraceae bacterium]
MHRYKTLLISLLLLFTIGIQAQQSGSISLALMKYKGGGDWYANPTSLPNLAGFCNTHLGTNFKRNIATVEVGSLDIFNYPFIHMTGHGNVLFSDQEADNLRQYLIAGGFLHIDDNYGMDPYIRVAMKKVFPEKEFVELPFNHPIYIQKFKFPNGLPKIHEHDGKPPRGYGIFWEGRLVCFYSYESDLGDGWEDQSVHNDPEDKRLAALRMGANIISYVFLQ